MHQAATLTETSSRQRIMYVGNTMIGLWRYKSENMPVIPSSAIITDASISLFQSPTTGIDPASGATITIGAKAITSYWHEDYVTYSSGMPTIADSILDYNVITPLTNGVQSSWNITSTAQKWYSDPSTNNGIAFVGIATTGYSKTSGRFYTVNKEEDSYKPTLHITYIDNKGVENYWTNHSLSADDAGVVYVNDYSGNVVYLNDLITVPGNILPATVGLVYNGYLAGQYFAPGACTLKPDFSNMAIGAGFKLNVQETLTNAIIGNTYYLVHSDSDGTDHFYYVPEGGTVGVYISEDGLPFTINQNGANYIMSDESGNTKTFNSSGNIIEIKDSHGNRNVFTYNGSKQLARVYVYPSGSTSHNDYIDFTYSNGMLNYIAGIYKKYVFNYSSTTIKTLTSVVEQSYITSPTPTYVTINTYNFTYDSNYHLTSVKDNMTTRSANIAYSSDKRAVSLFEKAGSSEGQRVLIDRNEHGTVKFRTAGKDDIINNSDDIINVYLFDSSGRTINTYTTDMLGNSINDYSTVYGASSAGYNTLIGSKKNNTISKSGSSGITSGNLIRYSSFEEDPSTVQAWWNAKTVSSNHFASFNSATSYVGAKSLSFIAADTGSSMYRRTFTLAANQKYTLSAYVKTSNVTGGIGAYLQIGSDENRSEALTETTGTGMNNEWQRISVSYTPTSSGVYDVSLAFSASSGVALFDAIQFEKGEIGAYNLVDNGTFDDLSSGWTVSSSGVGINASGIDGNSLEFTGTPTDSLVATQTIRLDCPVNTTFILSGWGKGDSVAIPDGSGRSFQVKATFTYMYSTGFVSGTTITAIAKINPQNNKLQYTMEPAVPTEWLLENTVKCYSVTIEISYKKNANSSLFDNISLTMEAAQTYSYDDDGHISTVQSPDGNAPAYVYNESNDLININNVDGSGYAIQYNEDEGGSTHQVNNITDANNIKVSYSYDSRGNVTGVQASNINYSGTVMSSYSGYDGTGKYCTSSTDELGNTTTYGYNMLAIREAVMQKHNVTVDDSVIESVLRFDTADIGDKYLATIRLAAEAYTEGIFRRLREHEYNPELMRLFVVGGGGCMIRNFGRYDKSRVTIIDDICATAKGYEYLACRKMQRNGGAV